MTSSKRIIVALSLLLIFVLAGFLGGPGNEPEQSIMAMAADLRSSIPLVARASAVMTLLGGFPFTIGVAVIAALTLLLRKRWTPALLLLGTVLVERLVIDFLKDWVGRPRPLAEQLPGSLAFPSGHSANSMTAFLAVALIAVPPAHRTKAAAAAISLSVLVGLTRIILGVHWPSDVIGGWVFGLMAVGTAMFIAQRSGALPLEAQHDVVGGHLPPSREEKSA